MARSQVQRNHGKHNGLTTSRNDYRDGPGGSAHSTVSRPWIAIQDSDTVQQMLAPDALLPLLFYGHPLPLRTRRLFCQLRNYLLGKTSPCS